MLVVKCCQTRVDRLLIIDGPYLVVPHRRDKNPWYRGYLIPVVLFPALINETKSCCFGLITLTQLSQGCPTKRSLLRASQPYLRLKKKGFQYIKYIKDEKTIVRNFCGRPLIWLVEIGWWPWPVTLLSAEAEVASGYVARVAAAPVHGDVDLPAYRGVSILFKPGVGVLLPRSRNKNTFRSKDSNLCLWNLKHVSIVWELNTHLQCPMMATISC